MKKIFISYRRAEAPHAAGALGRDLRRHFGEAQVFRDQEDIGGGVSWRQKVLNEIDRDSVLLVLIGGDWAQARDAEGKRRLDNPGDPIRLEISDGIKDGAAVIPVLLENSAMPREADLPPDLKTMADLNAMRLRDGDWDYDLGKILATLERAGFEPLRPPPQAPERDTGARRGGGYWGTFAASVTITVLVIAAHESEWTSDEYWGGALFAALALGLAIYAYTGLKNVSRGAKWSAAAAIALSGLATFGYVGSAVEPGSRPQSADILPAPAPQPVPQPSSPPPQASPQPVPQPATQANSAVAYSNVAGTWQRPDGPYWTIAQSGPQLIIQEVNARGGVNGRATGSVQGNTLHLSYVTADGDRGTGLFRIAPDGRQMSGRLVDQATNESMNLELFRADLPIQGLR